MFDKIDEHPVVCESLTQTLNVLEINRLAHFRSVFEQDFLCYRGAHGVCRYFSFNLDLLAGHAPKKG